MMRAERTEWFVDRDPFLPKMQELLEIGVFLPLLVKDDSNRHIFVIRTSAHNPKIHHMNDVFKVNYEVYNLEKGNDTFFFIILKKLLHCS